MSRSRAQDEDVRNKILRRLVGDAEAGTLGSLEHYLAEYSGHEELVRDEYHILTARREATHPEAASAGGPGERVARQAEGGFSGDVLRRLSGRRVTFERYTLTGEVGSGGQGTVLRVFDEDLCRHLAMKVLRQQVWEQAEEARERVDTRSLAQFLEEAQVTAQLDHPGIVPVHELGLDAGGRVYFTMKLVKGQTLQEVFELVAKGADGWTRTRALSVLLRVCEAMAYAHAKGVIHRDLKPSNVMVGRYGEVYVMDWGLARTLDRPDEKDVRVRPDAPSTIVRSERREQAASSPDPDLVTMDGDVIGTPAYMSPEQAVGRVEEMGPAADVYAVGAMLYHLLAGHKPYVEPGTRRSSLAIWYQVQKGPPEALAKRAPDAPTELVAICEKAMARDWRDRYGDMAELAEDLRAFLEHRVVAAYRTGAWVELRKWVERNKALASSAAAAVLLLIAGLTTSLIFKARSDRNAKLARENAEEAGRQASIARTNEERANSEAEAATRRADEVLRLSALQELDDLTAEADRLWPAHPENVPRYEEWLQESRELVAELPDHERKRAELRARSVPWTEEEHAKHCAEHPKHAELETARRHLEHHAKLRTALESSEPPKDPSPEEVGLELASLPTTANDANNLAWPLIDPDRNDWGGEAKGLVLARHALELAADLPAAERAGIRDSLAWALFANGRFDEAVAEEEQALEEAPADKKKDFQGYMEKLKEKIEEEIDPGKEGEHSRHLAELEQDIAKLEAEISKRPEWTFADAQDKWWHNQLEKLVSGLRVFSDPQAGVASSGTSIEHGWGVERRAEFARTSAERSVSSGEASAKWAAAITSIANVSDCPLYGGLRLSPQLGLLPIGRDPDSGLCEFAHLQTGEPAVRGPDGKLVLKEETGLVFVLLPGGTFWMGAQNGDPNGPNYDPQARDDEDPVHPVTLSAFFLSKYEMTQGQWERFTGRNPSYYDRDHYSPGWNRGRKVWSALHPVEQVSWVSCDEAMLRLGLSLPSEAQWEHGARAGTVTSWWPGDEPALLAEAANLSDAYAKANGGPIGAWESWDDGNTCHAEVGQYRANAFGLHDVHGNVWEWCRDGYQQDFYGQEPKKDPVSDPAGSSLRVNRGGSFGFAASAARSAVRGPAGPEGAGGHLGCRPARRITP